MNELDLYLSFPLRPLAHERLGSLNLEVGNPVRLTNHPAGEWNPAWSPDGTWIAFVSNRVADGGWNEIYVMRADGSNPVSLTNNPADDGDPDWSPDSQ